MLKLFLIWILFTLVASSSDARHCKNGKSAGTYDCSGVDLQGKVRLADFAAFSGVPMENAAGVWGYLDRDDNREYAVIGLSGGTGIVEVTNPQKPRIVGVIPGLQSLWREVKVYSVFNEDTQRWDAYAYVTTEAPQGLQIIDLSKLPDSVSLARVDNHIQSAHTLFISNIDFATGEKRKGLKPYLYVEGSNLENGGLNVFSLKKPTEPRLIGSYQQTYVHDIYVETFRGEDARRCGNGKKRCEVVFAWAGQDLRLIDFTDKKEPKTLSKIAWPNLGYSHSGWISSDKQWLFNFDELDEIRFQKITRIRAINISDFKNPDLVSIWRGPTKEIEHNGIVIGNKLYVAHYTRGLVILDVTNPKKMKEAAFFDTHSDESDSLSATHEGKPVFRGAWGVYPFLPSGHILISDMQGGLFILKEQ